MSIKDVLLRVAVYGKPLSAAAALRLVYIPPEKEVKMRASDKTACVRFGDSAPELRAREK
jgi:hypothetical protein